MRKTERIFSTISLVLSITFFALGVYFPLFSTKTQVLDTDWSYEVVSLIDTIVIFFIGKEYIFATVILAITIIIPAIEYIELILRIIFKKERSKTMQHLDKWSMLDVLLVALILINFRISPNFITMEVRIGATFIALAVIFRVLTIGFNIKSE